jgi:hypothetical protein
MDGMSWCLQLTLKWPREGGREGERERERERSSKCGKMLMIGEEYMNVYFVILATFVKSWKVSKPKVRKKFWNVFSGFVVGGGGGGIDS